LVHLSNGFCLLGGASPLHAGNAVTTEAKIASVINTGVGKAAKVIGNVIHDRKPIIEVTSLLYGRHFTDYGNTFEIVQEPDYVMEYPTDASVAVLLLLWEERFELRDQSEITFKSKVSYHSIPVPRDVYVRDKTSRLATWTLSGRIATETRSLRTFSAMELPRVLLPTFQTMDTL
jgi:fatty acid synthase subunit alpha